MPSDHRPITEEELREMEGLAEECHCYDCTDEFKDVRVRERRLISEVRRLREALGDIRKVADTASTDYDAAQGCHIGHIDSIAEGALGEGRCGVNPACDAAGGHSRCFKDGRWLDDGSEM